MMQISARFGDVAKIAVAFGPYVLAVPLVHSSAGMIFRDGPAGVDLDDVVGVDAVLVSVLQLCPERVIREGGHMSSP